MNSGQRTSNREKVRYNQQIPFQKFFRRVGDQYDFIKKLAINFINSIQNSDPAHPQEGFLGAIIAGGQPAGQYHPTTWDFAL